MPTLAAPSLVRLLRCELQGRGFALPLAQVRSIQRAERLVRLDSDTPLIGSLSYSKEDMPIFSLARVLNLPESADPGDHMIILGDPPNSWGLLVEKTSQLGAIPTSAIHRIPEMIAARCDLFSGVLQSEQGPLVLLEPNQIGPEEVRTHSESRLYAQAVSPELPPGSENEQQLLVCTLNESFEIGRPVRFGLSALQTMELLDYSDVLPLSGIGQEIIGLVPWRGRFLAVVDAGIFLGLPPFVPHSRCRLLVLRPSGHQEAFAIPLATTPKLISGNQAHEASSRSLGLNPEFHRGVIETLEQTLVLLDADLLV